MTRRKAQYYLNIFPFIYLFYDNIVYSNETNHVINGIKNVLLAWILLLLLCMM